MARRRPALLTSLRSVVPHGTRILAAVSGGADSMVLLDALLRSRRIHQLSVEVCHIDHGLRESSRRDAEFVAAQCAARGVVCHVVRLGARPSKTNMEAWARQERYRALMGIREERGCDWIVTAHTASDVAETLLIRLLARKELGSIAEVDHHRRCLRPLLGVAREEIHEYAAKHGVQWIEDPTNDDQQIVRNRVRHTLLPVLRREFDPSITWILAEQAASLADDVAALRWVAEREAVRLGALQERSPAWTAAAEGGLRELPEGIQWRVVEQLLLERLGYRLGERRARGVLGVLLGESKVVQLTKTVQLVRERGELRFIEADNLA